MWGRSASDVATRSRYRVDAAQGCWSNIQRAPGEGRLPALVRANSARRLPSSFKQVSDPSTLTKPSPMPSQATTLGGGSALGRLRAEAGDGTVPQITAEQATPTHDPRPLLVDRLTADAPDLPCRGEDIRE